MSLILSGTDGLSDVDGSAATPAIRGTDANTGIFFPAADTIAFSEGGAECARIDASGNLGLGVTPSAWSSFKAMQIGAGTVLYNNSNANGSFLGSNFYWNGTNNIYIGTSTATAYAQTSGQHQWFNAASGTAGNTVSFTQAMTLDASGNLGIGTSSPSSWSNLAVLGSNGTGFAGITAGNSNANTGIGGIQFASDTTYTKAAIGLLRQNSNGVGPLVFYQDTNTDAANWSTGDEKMRLEAAGNLCVGVQGNYSNGRITGFHATSGYFTFRSDSSLAAATSWGHFYGTSASNGVANISIYGNGSIQNATGSYAAYSDIKLKENIVDATPKLADLMQVRIRNYNLKGELGYETSKQIGVIAQELEEVFPSLIEEAPDRDSDGNELGTTTKGVKYSIFIPMLIKAIQEQQALIQSLTARITALETP